MGLFRREGRNQFRHELRNRGISHDEAPARMQSIGCRKKKSRFIAAPLGALVLPALIFMLFFCRRCRRYLSVPPPSRSLQVFRAAFRDRSHLLRQNVPASKILSATRQNPEADARRKSRKRFHDKQHFPCAQRTFRKLCEVVCGSCHAITSSLTHMHAQRADSSSRIVFFVSSERDVSATER